jgi:adenosine deaminase
VQEGIEEGEDAVDRSGRDIRVGQLITAMRHADRSLEIARLAVAFRGRGAVGFDIAGRRTASRRRVIAPRSIISPPSSSR